MKEEVMKENSYQVQGIGSGGSLLKSFRRAPISKRSGIHPSSTFFSRNISNDPVVFPLWLSDAICRSEYYNIPCTYIIYANDEPAPDTQS